MKKKHVQHATRKAPPGGLESRIKGSIPLGHRDLEIHMLNGPAKPLKDCSLREISEIHHAHVPGGSHYNGANSRTFNGVSSPAQLLTNFGAASIEQKSDAGRNKLERYGDLRQTITSLMRDCRLETLNDVLTFLETNGEKIEDRFYSLTSTSKIRAHSFEVHRDTQSISYTDNKGRARGITSAGLGNLISRIKTQQPE